MNDAELFLAGVPHSLIPAVRSDETYDQLAEYLPREAARVVVNWIRGLLETDIRDHEIRVTPGPLAVVNALETAGVPTLELKPRQRDPGHGERGVRYGAKKRIKGLEFKAIALLPGKEDASRPNIVRFANHVAATRARQNLLVVSMVGT